MRHHASFALIVVGLLLAPSTSCQSLPATKLPVNFSGAAIPFELVTRHVMLKVTVNNSRPLSFVFDTGNKFGIIDLDVARELGLKLQGEINVGGGGGQTIKGSFVQGSSFAIPGLEGFSQAITLAIPLGNLAHRFGHDFDGIIGSEFIKQFVVELDYQARLIKLYDKNKFIYSGQGEVIPIQLNSFGHPIIAAEVTPIGSDPIKGKFVLDVGSGEALGLNSPFVAEHHLLGPGIKTIRAIGRAGAGGEITGQVGRVSELKIGKIKISNPLTFFSEDKAGASASSAVLGNIGGQIMSRFKILLDYSHDRIILEPGTTLTEPFGNAFSGFSFQAEGKDYRTFRITDVLESSPGSEAGLQKNDVITAIDGRPAAELTLTKLTEMFERPVPYKLTLRRGEQTLEVILTPRRLV
jgi:Aspartyl protease/PDZ domain